MAEAQDLEQAKAFLMKSGTSGLNIYEHLTNVLSRLLDQRQENGVDNIEDISKDIKAGTFNIETTLKVIY